MIRTFADERRDDDADEREADLAGRRAATPGDDEDQRGPDEVELLLDRKAPEVEEGRRRRHAGEVVAGGEGEPDVRDGHRRGRAIETDGWAIQRRDDVHRRDQCDDEDDEGRRQQPAGPPGVELEEADAARPLALPQEQTGDEEAADHEEDVDADVPADHPEQVGVE